MITLQCLNVTLKKCIKKVENLPKKVQNKIFKGIDF